VSVDASDRGGPALGGDEIRGVRRSTRPGFLRAGRSWDVVIMDQLGLVGAAIIERLGIAGDQEHLGIAAGASASLTPS
jgi:hypothetical protein